MQKTINYKIKTKLIQKLLEEEFISELSKPSTLSKLTFKKKQLADIYFHNGNLDKEASENIKNAKRVIVNSLTSRHQLLKELDTPKDKIEVLYPAIDIEYKKPKEVKEKICDELDIDKSKKLVFFTASNLKSSGVIEFINIVMHLNLKNVVAIIAGEKKQIFNLRFQLSKFNVEDKIILLEDYENKDELYLASDVFLLPTHTKNFASSILKAMFCKCAVFTTVNNAAKEVIDVFSMMESPSDRSMQFKLTALLQNKDDLKLIKKQNRKIAKQYTLENQYEKLKELISKI